MRAATPTHAAVLALQRDKVIAWLLSILTALKSSTSYFCCIFCVVIHVVLRLHQTQGLFCYRAQVMQALTYGIGTKLVDFPYYRALVTFEVRKRPVQVRTQGQEAPGYGLLFCCKCECGLSVGALLRAVMLLFSSGLAYWKRHASIWMESCNSVS